MKKSDLKTGMRVETREGELYLVIKDVTSAFYGHQEVAFVNNSDFLIGSDYHEDLLCIIANEYDIVKVYQGLVRNEALLNTKILNLNVKFLIWERKEPKYLTKRQIENILGYEVEIIKE